jgi:hypothetical protein
LDIGTIIQYVITYAITAGIVIALIIGLINEGKEAEYGAALFEIGVRKYHNDK